MNIVTLYPAMVIGAKGVKLDRLLASQSRNLRKKFPGYCVAWLFRSVHARRQAQNSQSPLLSEKNPLARMFLSESVTYQSSGPWKKELLLRMAGVFWAV